MTCNYLHVIEHVNSYMFYDLLTLPHEVLIFYSFWDMASCSSIFV